jgi:hypothetical protein
LVVHASFDARSIGNKIIKRGEERDNTSLCLFIKEAVLIYFQANAYLDDRNPSKMSTIVWAVLIGLTILVKFISSLSFGSFIVWAELNGSQAPCGAF